MVFHSPGSRGPRDTDRTPWVLLTATRGLPSSPGGPPTASYAVGAPAILCAGRSVRSSLLLDQTPQEPPTAIRGLPSSPGRAYDGCILSG
ncbi:hypothetical protein NDU88_001672 [Pleurodeles waltl]|uniref:Uncharacterized protein n=1 Tax=Pleurodeles waltl TaxID=8319 RepID=A0AAV7UXE1_PLEWA|nr:hypothetical protein NDU88_001672 [Pleurodeles waltl]